MILLDGVNSFFDLLAFAQSLIGLVETLEIGLKIVQRKLKGFVKWLLLLVVHPQDLPKLLVSYCELTGRAMVFQVLNKVSDSLYRCFLVRLELVLGCLA